MDCSALQRQLQIAEDLVERVAENIALQRQMIATLDGGGHETKAAKTFLKWLEARHAKHVADRDQLFGQLANRF